ncbi:uncharacterized protein LOC116207977 [Punica granatum]|uniref:Uncharacterized protein n=2 Tax=Punica granatum TaxID=22663 RepID=A0A2I0JDY8_PUNGR|nr:uncharacterized protein LOC116207977 [Punica granatum]PKI54439.1 hypothetical protein CRG98_025226 [Punica granatum]
MASTTAGRFFIPLLSMVLIQLGLLLPVAGRPCKTLLVYSDSFTLTREPIFRLNPNPTRDVIYVNLPTSDPSSSSSGFVTIFTTAFPAVQHDSKPGFFLGHRGFPTGSSQVQRQERKQGNTLGVFDLSSLRDRSKDILSVVIALLFGVGCGALTAVTMYMAWSLFSNNGGHYLQESDDEYDFDVSPKKMGYVKIPAANPSSFPSKA